jgi:hypothetical protein
MRCRTGEVSAACAIWLAPEQRGWLIALHQTEYRHGRLLIVEESEKKDGRGSFGFLCARLRSHEFGDAQTSHALVFVVRQFASLQSLIVVRGIGNSG